MARRNGNGGRTATASPEPTPQAAPHTENGNGNGSSPPVYSRKYPIGSGESVEVAVFAREVDNTGVKRHYKSGDEWKENKFFPPHALPVVAQALNLAFQWISEERSQS